MSALLHFAQNILDSASSGASRQDWIDHRHVLDPPRGIAVLARNHNGPVRLTNLGYVGAPRRPEPAFLWGQADNLAALAIAKCYSFHAVPKDFVVIWDLGRHLIKSSEVVQKRIAK